MPVLLSCPCGKRFWAEVIPSRQSVECPACGRTQPVSSSSPGTEAIRTEPAPAAPPIQVAGRAASAAPPSPPRQWQRWIAPVCCAVVAVGLVIGVPIGIYSAASSRVSNLDRELKQMPQRRLDRLAAAESAVRGRHLQLTVSGPASLQAGAPNAFRLETRNLQNELVPARLSARVRNEANEIVYEQRDVVMEGEYRLLLPPDLPLKPQTVLSLEVTAQVEGQDAPTARVTEQLALDGRAYVTHLATDKPLYRPGEVVAFRSLTLDRFTLKPIAEDLELAYTITDGSGQQVFKLEGPARFVDPRDGKPLLGPDGKPLRGLGAGEFAIPADYPGGEYTLTVKEAANRFPSQRRTFLVNRYEKPRLNKELTFTRRSYDPGDRVTAACRVARVEGGAAVANQPVSATVRVDGKTYGADGQEARDDAIRLKTDDTGAVVVSFTLPASIAVGEASLSVRFTDGGSVETIVRSIPVVLKKLLVDFFPEGGDLVAGVPNRVYFQVRTPTGKPAELKGRLVGAGGQTVAEAQTLSDPEKAEANQGLGRFSFTPQAGQRYELKVDSPGGIAGSFFLPEAKADGVLLSIAQGVTGDREPIRATVQSSGRDRKLVVGAYCRGRLLDDQTVMAKKGEATAVELKPSMNLGGVCRVTVFEERERPVGRIGNPANDPAGLPIRPTVSLVPVAERLVYRAPAERLKLTARPDRKLYIPGDKVTLSLSAQDEKDQPAPAVLIVTVVDQSVLALADDRTLHTLPTHFLLTSEVRKPEDLEYADFLLTEHPQAAVALDLLLGTQGWRRFAEQDPARFRREQGEAAESLLASMGQTLLRTSNRAAVEAASQPLIAQERQKAEAEWQKEQSALRQEHAAAASQLHALKKVGNTLGTLAWIALGLIVVVSPLVIAVACFAMHMKKGGSPGYVAGGFAALVVFGSIGVGGIGWVLFRGGGGAAITKPAEGGTEFVRDGAPFILGNRPKTAAPDWGKEKDKAPDRAPEFGSDPQRPAALKPIPPVPPPGERFTTALGYSQERDRLLRGVPRRAAGERTFRQGRDDPSALPPLVVREYAHKRTAGAAGTRIDFTETLYWHPVLVLTDGQGQVSFDLCDSMTTFQVAAFGHTTDGRLGAVTATLESRLPFSIEPKVPIEVTASDKIDLPVTVANDTGIERTVNLRLQLGDLKLLQGMAEEKLTLAANQRTRRLYRLQPSIVEGDARVFLDGTSQPFAADSILRAVKVVPEGFPVVGARSGLLRGVVNEEIPLPETWFKGTLKCQLQVYPSILADAQSGLDGLLREPFG